MAQVTFSYTGYAHPAWAAEPLEAEKLIPGGARLDAAVFSTVQSGTLVGRTFTERDNRAPYGPPDVTTPDDELFLTAFSVPDLAQNADVTLVRHGTLIYEDKLPGWAGLASNVKAAIRARYQCIRSA